MACNLQTINAIEGQCDKSYAGIKAIYIAPRSAAVITTTQLTADEEVPQSGLTLAASSATMSAVFSKWEFRRNTGSYTSTITSDIAIGNTTCETNVTLQFSKAEAHKRMAIMSAINSDNVVVVEDNYGRYMLLGEKNSVYITEATMVSGTNPSDLSGFTLTLNDVNETLPHYLVESFDITQLTTRS